MNEVKNALVYVERVWLYNSKAKLCWRSRTCITVSLSWYSWYSGLLSPSMCYSNREGNFWRWITSKPFKLWPLNLVTSLKNYFRKSSWRIRLHWRKHGNQVSVAMFFKSCILVQKVGFNYIFTTGYITLN